MQSWAVTDAGCVRTQNQDTYKIEPLQNNALLCVVCDGMGGAKSGNVASTLAAEIFCHEIRASWNAGMDEKEVDELLRRAVKLANFTVYDQAKEVEDFHGMGTTMVALLLQGERATVLNVGDSRAYHMGPKGIRLVTSDHTLVQLLVKRGDMTLEEAKNAPDKNLITRAIGTEAAVICDLFHMDVMRGECVLLCSDGLSNLVDEQEILFEIVHGEKQDCCQRLLAIATNRGAPDNVTALLVQA